MGENWTQIQREYFPDKVRSACRRRHGEIMELGIINGLGLQEGYRTMKRQRKGSMAQEEDEHEATQSSDAEGKSETDLSSEVDDDGMDDEYERKREQAEEQLRPIKRKTKQALKRELDQYGGSDMMRNTERLRLDKEYNYNEPRYVEESHAERRRRARLKDKKEASNLEREKKYEELGVQEKEPERSANAEDPEFTSAFVIEEIAQELPYYEDGTFGADSPSDTKASTVLSSDDHPRLKQDCDEDVKNSALFDSIGLQEVHILSHSDNDSNDSYMSDLESILSEAPSLASSQSSMPLDVNTGAIDEFRSLLLLNDTLKPLYEEAIHKVGAERFQRNFKRLLVRYGRALGSEASTPLQVQAARFIRFAALRVSVQIKNILINKHEQADRERAQEARTKVLAYLKQMDDAKNDMHDEGADSSSEDGSIYDPEETGLRSLESVKNFMVSSTAFSHLCIALKEWLNPGCEDEKQPPAQASQGKKPEEPNHTPVDVLMVIPDQKATGVSDEKTGVAVINDTVVKTDHCVEKTSIKQTQYIGSCKTQSSWTSDMRRGWQNCRNISSDLFQRGVPKGQVRVSWTCVSSTMSPASSHNGVG